MKCLVTGGAGFIGSNLALELENQGHEVTIIDNLLTGNKNNLKEFKGEFIELDISNPFDLNKKFEVIFHEASITDPRYPNDEETYNKNIQGFNNIINFAQKINAKLIYASTAGLYGNGTVPMEEAQEKEILNAYGKSKLEMDRIAGKLFDKMHIVGLRYFNVYGPREVYKGKPASMIYHLGKQIKDGKNPRIFEFGQQKRDHIYVKDVVDAIIKSVNSKSGIYNVGTGIATTFIDLIKILNEVFGAKLEVEYFKMPYDTKTYQNNTQAHTKHAEESLGFYAKWTLRDGIKDYINWLNKNGW